MILYHHFSNPSPPQFQSPIPICFTVHKHFQYVFFYPLETFLRSSPTPTFLQWPISSFPILYCHFSPLRLTDPLLLPPATLACTHTHTHTQRLTHSHTHTHTHTHTQRITHTYTYTLTHTHTHTHTHTQTESHTHIHIHTHTHTHTHTYANSPPRWLSGWDVCCDYMMPGFQILTKWHQWHKLWCSSEPYQTPCVMEAWYINN